MDKAVVGGAIAVLTASAAAAYYMMKPKGGDCPPPLVWDSEAKVCKCPPGTVWNGVFCAPTSILPVIRTCNDASECFSYEGCIDGRCQDPAFNPSDAGPAGQDTDQDGYTDWEEGLYGTNPYDPDSHPLVDSDQDGYTDHEEYEAGTDPLDPDSHPTAPLAVCVGGVIVDNQCVCPDGQHPVMGLGDDSICTPDEPILTKCPYPTEYNEETRKCECVEEGTVWNGEYCVPPKLCVPPTVIIGDEISVYIAGDIFTAYVREIERLNNGDLYYIIASNNSGRREKLYWADIKCGDGLKCVAGECVSEEEPGPEPDCPDGTVWDDYSQGCIYGSGTKNTAPFRVRVHNVDGSDREATFKIEGIAGDTPVSLTQTTILGFTDFHLLEGNYNIYILKPGEVGANGNPFYQYMRTIRTWGVYSFDEDGVPVTLVQCPPDTTQETNSSIGLPICAVTIDAQTPKTLVTISIVIKELMLNTPLEGAVVTLSGELLTSPIVATTNVTGTILINNIQTGTYHLGVVLGDWVEVSQDIEISEDEDFHVGMVACPPGQHLDDSGACVACPDGTKWNGQYCEDQPCPPYSHWEDASGECVPDIVVGDQGNLSIYVHGPAGAVPSAAIRLRQGVWGTDNGQGSGYWRYWGDDSVETNGVTDANGAFSIALPTGAYKLTITKAGYLSPDAENIAVTADTSIDVALEVLEVLEENYVAITTEVYTYVGAPAIGVEWWDHISNGYASTAALFYAVQLNHVYGWAAEKLADGNWNQAQYDSFISSLTTICATYACDQPPVSVPVVGCADPAANNYNPDATEDDGSCTYSIPGCTDPAATNYNSAATVDDGSCNDVLGCTEPAATNYNPAASVDDGSCTYMGTITGQVLGIDTGQPISGAIVDANQVSSTTTGADGRFSYAAPVPNSIVIMKAGYYSRTIRISSSKDLGPIWLTPASIGGIPI